MLVTLQEPAETDRQTLPTVTAADVHSAHASKGFKQRQKNQQTEKLLLVLDATGVKHLASHKGLQPTWGTAAFVGTLSIKSSSQRVVSTHSQPTACLESQSAIISPSATCIT